jgi:sec-independent protein translocase protein TatA
MPPGERSPPVSLGPAEILVIFVVALLVFGPTRLPEVGRQVGRGMRELRKFQQTLKGDLDDAFSDDSSDVPPTPSTPVPPEPAPTLPPKELTETDPTTPPA